EVRADTWVSLFRSEAVGKDEPPEGDRVGVRGRFRVPPLSRGHSRNHWTSRETAWRRASPHWTRSGVARREATRTCPSALGLHGETALQHEVRRAAASRCRRTG